MAPKVFHLLFFTFLLFQVLSISHGNREMPSGKISSPFEFINQLKGCHKGNTTKGIHNLKNYLKRFGYLDDNDENDDEFDDALESAVKLYQQNYHITPTGILDAKTASQMIVPRCGVPDIVNGTNRMRTTSHEHDSSLFHIVSHYSFLPNSPRWPATKTNLTYRFLTNTPTSFITAVVRAFQKWESATHFSFSQTTGTTSDLVLGFRARDHGDGAPFDGPFGVLAHAFAPTNGVLHFDAEETWSPATGPVSGTIHLETVALHEIGHLLGLGHSSIQEAIMFSGIGLAQVKNLNEDDLQGIRALYNV